MTSLRKVRIGDCIEQVKIKCGIPNLTVFDVSGINKDKEFFTPTKQVGADTSDYKIVPPNCFACNLMHVGRDVVLPIAINRTSSNKIVSGAYTVFKFIDESKLLMDYFFIFLKSSEKDRFFWFHCDSSVRDGMDWEVFCNVELEVPSIDIQKKYVAIYEGLLLNLSSYEKGLDDLLIVYQGLIESYKKEQKSESILPYIEEIKETNKAGIYGLDKLRGVGQDGFIDPKQKRDVESLRKCGVFHINDFVYNPSVLYAGAIALNKEFDVGICTEEYVIFKSKDTNKLIPEYLFMWLKRKECGRMINFMSIDSVRNRIYFEDLKMIEIPIVSKEKQQNAVDIFKATIKRRQFVDELKTIINRICPILIRGSILEAKGGDSNGD